MASAEENFRSTFRDRERELVDGVHSFVVYRRRAGAANGAGFTGAGIGQRAGRVDRVVAGQGAGAGDDVDLDRGADWFGDGGGDRVDGGLPGDRCAAHDEYSAG